MTLESSAGHSKRGQREDAAKRMAGFHGRRKRKGGGFHSSSSFVLVVVLDKLVVE
jgi:hypothetical protein